MAQLSPTVPAAIYDGPDGGALLDFLEPGDLATIQATSDKPSGRWYWVAIPSKSGTEGAVGWISAAEVAHDGGTVVMLSEVGGPIGPVQAWTSGVQEIVGTAGTTLASALGAPAAWGPLLVLGAVGLGLMLLWGRASDTRVIVLKRS